MMNVTSSPQSDAADDQLLRGRARPDGTLHVGVGTLLALPTQAALERCIARDFLRLADIVPDPNNLQRLVRVFQITEAGRLWLADRGGRVPAVLGRARPPVPPTRRPPSK